MQNTNEYVALSIPELVNIITSVNMVIMFAILFFRKQNTTPNRILAVILLLPGISFINNYFVLSGFIYHFPSIIFITQVSAFLCAPLIYHYSMIFMGKKDHFSSPLHVLSFLSLIACCIFWVLFMAKDPSQKQTIVTELIQEIPPFYLVVLRGAFFMLLNAYFISIAYQVWVYSKRILNIKSDLEQLKLRYLQQFAVLIWILNIVTLIGYLILPNFYVDYIAVPIVLNVFYVFLIKTSFHHTAIFTTADFGSFKNNLSQIEAVNLTDNAKKELSQETVDILHNKVAYLLDTEKIFTDPEINILKLSEAIDQPVHITSLFINTYMHSNFFNLINAKRIELAKEKMKQYGEKSEIEVIGYQVGFNSKSAFYRAFQKYVQQTPSDYIRSMHSGNRN